MAHRILGVILVTIVLALQACAPKAQTDCGYVQNSYGERISWKGQLPVSLQIHQSVPDQFIPAIKAAVDTWNSNAGTTVFVIAGDHYAGNPANQDQVNVISFSPTWDPNLLSEQAKTQVYWIGDQIQEADVKVNASSVNGNPVYQFYSDTEIPNAINIQALLLHELGHVLGLKHIDGVGSVMATYLANDANRTSLASVDVSNLKCEY